MKFTEIQQFRQWWLWLFLAGLTIFTIYIIYQQLILGVPFGNKPMTDFWLIIYALFVTCFIAMFYFMALKTEIDKDKISVQFFPFVKKYIPWKDVHKSEIITYGFVGGWGIRLGTRYGKVYNIEGNQGLSLELKTGKKLLIGTQKEEELKDFLIQISAE